MAESDEHAEERLGSVRHLSRVDRIVQLRGRIHSPGDPHMTTAYLTIPSPVGELLLTAVDDGLTRLWFEEHRHGGGVRAEWRHADAAGGSAARALRSAHEQLDAYFAGERTTFDLPLVATGTPFQERVWAALRTIPFGHTMSYG